jgi:RNA polymerase sigma-70 factor (ECF subfamily)
MVESSQEHMNRPDEFQRIAMPQLQAAYGLAHVLLRSRSEAEDAVQDSYLRAFRAFEQFRGEAFKPWFLTIVRHVCYRRLQQLKRGYNVISLNEVLVDEGPAFEVASDAPTPEEALLQAGEALELQNILSALPPALREVLHLREIEELSYQQIAAATGVPVGTVMSRLSRARAQVLQIVAGPKGMDGKNAL